MKIEKITNPTWEHAHDALVVSGYIPEFDVVICDKLRCLYCNSATRRYATIIIDGGKIDDAIDDRPVSVDGATIVSINADDEEAYLALG